MNEHSPSDVQWFRANGREAGIAVLVIAAVAAGLLIAAGELGPLGVVLVGAVLIHASVLRPRVGATRDHLVYRRLFSDLWIPLRGIEGVKVVRYFEVTVAGRRIISPAISRPRSTVRPRRRWFPETEQKPRAAYADLVEDAVRTGIADARARSGSGQGPVRRTWAWGEIAVGVASVVALIVLLLL